jgi:hypothetical protein
MPVSLIIVGDFFFFFATATIMEGVGGKGNHDHDVK